MSCDGAGDSGKFRVPDAAVSDARAPAPAGHCAETANAWRMYLQITPIASCLPCDRRLPAVHGGLLAVALVCLTAATFAQAQSPARRVPSTLNPDVSATTRLPAGQDAGTPSSSENLPLGTPVPPSPTVRPGAPGVDSAAARAAARPLAPARSTRSTRVPAGPAPLSGATDPLHPEATLTARERRRIATGTAKPSATLSPATRRACSTDELALRASISSCTRLLDRSARSECVARATGGRDGKASASLPDCG